MAALLREDDWRTAAADDPADDCEIRGRWARRMAEPDSAGLERAYQAGAWMETRKHVDVASVNNVRGAHQHTTNVADLTLIEPDIGVECVEPYRLPFELFESRGRHGSRRDVGGSAGPPPVRQV